MKEAQIISGCQNGDRNAQRAFVDTYSQYLMTLCKRYAPSHDRAEDYLQESLIHILQKINQFDPNLGHFKAWIKTVTVRKCLLEIRKEKNMKYTDIEDSYDLGENENVHYKLQKDDVFRFMENIPNRYRIVINMYLVEGYSHKEIGEHLGVSTSASRTILTRARKLIQDKFKDSEVSLFRAS